MSFLSPRVIRLVLSGIPLVIIILLGVVVTLDGLLIGPLIVAIFAVALGVQSRRNR